MPGAMVCAAAIARRVRTGWGLKRTLPWVPGLTVGGHIMVRRRPRVLGPQTTGRTDAGKLTIGGVAVTALADEFGTPLYIYDEATIRARAALIRDAFAAAYPETHVVYAGKAFLN